MYAWDVEDGQAGVTDDMDAAITHVDLALRGASTGVRGAIRLVTVSMYGRSEYIDLGIVGEARRGDGGVLWTRRSSWWGTASSSVQSNSARTGTCREPE
ncbi:hypothetical protein [Actinomadura madurae]|nr:hypothetical protein [Actinomadura madurae]MCP9951659.1 hypothetical protein [Actinomadura madurae]MCP9968431.1 hypothetical protein [Actinomadura madurae]MCP9980903.1 hypothetical protein [Actinomadura madurae]MCQ0007597.1 hypothetical protein [Actinomadura madurae]MCQ0017096.1 hypothetical protein [Actinomadura madurae]